VERRQINRLDAVSLDINDFNLAARLKLLFSQTAPMTAISPANGYAFQPDELAERDVS
jgi:hypothetical protein